VAYRTFPQDRSFVGAIVYAIAALIDANDLRQPGTENFPTPNLTRSLAR
jgi:hypothetical protein